MQHIDICIPIDYFSMKYILYMSGILYVAIIAV